MNIELNQIIQQHLNKIDIDGVLESCETDNSGFLLSMDEVETAFRRDEFESVIEALNNVQNVSEEGKKSMKQTVFHVLELKAYKCLAEGNQKAALDVLRNEIAPMQRFPDRLHFLTQNILSLKQLGPEDKQSKIQNCINTLKEIPGLFRSEYRLLELIEQARQYQLAACLRHHGESKSTNLWVDHHCGKKDTIDAAPEKELIWENLKRKPTYLFLNNGHLFGFEGSSMYKILGPDRESMQATISHLANAQIWPKYWNASSFSSIIHLGEALEKIKVAEASISAIGIIPSRGLIIIADKDNQITSLWDLIEEKLLHSWIRMRCYHILTPDDANEGFFLAFTDGDEILQISTESFSIIKKLRIADPCAGISSAFMKGNRLLVSMTNSIIYYYDDWQEYEWPSRIFMGHTCKNCRTNAILSRYDPNILLAGSEDGNVFIWNINSGRLIFRLAIHEEAAFDLIEVAENEFVSSGFKGHCFKWSIPKNDH